jgi:hypothetical protein
MKDSYEQLFSQIRQESEIDGIVVVLMQDFVHNAFEEGQIEAIFEAVDRFVSDDSDNDAEINRSSFLEVAFDAALELGLIDVARRLASIKDEMEDAAFKLIRLAQRTKDEQDIRLARQAVIAMDPQDETPKANAFAKLFAVTRLPEDRAEAERLCEQLDAYGCAALAIEASVSLAGTTHSKQDCLRCIQLLEHSEKQNSSSDELVNEVLEVIPHQEMGQWLEHVKNPHLRARVMRIVRAKSLDTN